MMTTNQKVVGSNPAGLTTLEPRKINGSRVFLFLPVMHFSAVLKPFIDDVENYILPDKDGAICSETAFVRTWESYMTDLSTHLNGIQKRWYHRTKEWKETHQKEYTHYLELKEQKKETEAEEYRLSGWIDVSFRPHDLRHTFVTACRDRGVDIKVCMDWCGHASEKMILEIYDHPSETRENTAISLMDI